MVHSGIGSENSSHRKNFEIDSNFKLSSVNANSDATNLNQDGVYNHPNVLKPFRFDRKVVQENIIKTENTSRSNKRFSFLPEI